MVVIRQTRFADYFLIVWDIIRFAHQQGIWFGIRSSAPAALPSTAWTSPQPTPYATAWSSKGS